MCAHELTWLVCFKLCFYRHSSDLQLRYLYAPYVVHAILMVFCYISNFKTVIRTQLLKRAVYMSAFIVVIILCLVVHLRGKAASQTMGISKCFGC